MLKRNKNWGMESAKWKIKKKKFKRGRGSNLIDFGLIRKLKTIGNLKGLNGTKSKILKGSNSGRSLGELNQ